MSKKNELLSFQQRKCHWNHRHENDADDVRIPRAFVPIHIIVPYIWNMGQGYRKKPVTPLGASVLFAMLGITEHEEYYWYNVFQLKKMIFLA